MVIVMKVMMMMGPLSQLPDEPSGGAEEAPTRGLRCPGPGLLPHLLLVGTAVLINIFIFIISSTVLSTVSPQFSSPV